MLKRITTTLLSLVIGATLYASCPADWTNDQTYAVDTQVTYNGTVYAAKQEVPLATSPADSYFWEQLAPCVNEKINFAGDVEIGNPMEPKNLTVFGNFKMREGTLRLGYSPTTYMEANSYQMTFFTGGEGGSMSSKVTTNGVEVYNGSRMSNSKSELTAGQLRLSDSYIGQVTETVITQNNIKTPQLFINGTNIEAFLKSQQAQINDLIQRIEALEQP